MPVQFSQCVFAIFACSLSDQYDEQHIRLALGVDGSVSMIFGLVLAFCSQLQSYSFLLEFEENEAPLFFFSVRVSLICWLLLLIVLILLLLLLLLLIILSELRSCAGGSSLSNV